MAAAIALWWAFTSSRKNLARTRNGEALAIEQVFDSDHHLDHRGGDSCAARCWPLPEWSCGNSVSQKAQHIRGVSGNRRETSPMREIQTYPELEFLRPGLCCCCPALAFLLGRRRRALRDELFFFTGPWDKCYFAFVTRLPAASDNSPKSLLAKIGRVKKQGLRGSFPAGGPLDLLKAVCPASSFLVLFSWLLFSFAFFFVAMFEHPPLKDSPLNLLLNQLDQ